MNNQQYRDVNRLEQSGVACDESNVGSYNADISDDGRYIAFVSTATNLVPSDTNARADIFVYDRRMSRIERVSVGNGNVQYWRQQHLALAALSSRMNEFNLRYRLLTRILLMQT